MHWDNILKVVGVITQVAAILISLGTYIHVNNKENQEVRYSQANQISVWLLEVTSKDVDNVVVNNSSNNPIYDVVLSPGSLNKGVPYQKGNDVTISLPPIPPGRWSTKLLLASVTGMSSEPWVAIAFKDIRGQSWLRDVEGTLTPLRQSSREFMQVFLPASYVTIHRYKD